MDSQPEIAMTPEDGDLGLVRIANRTGLSISFLPNGAVFAIERVQAARKIMINQVLGSPVAGSMGRLYLRTGGDAPGALPLIGAEASVRTGAVDDRFVWQGEQQGLRHRVTLWLPPDLDAWFWRVEVTNMADRELPCDAVLIQDLGLGERNFLMGNEAYASQYLDHFVAAAPVPGPGADEPAKPVAGRRESLGRAWLSRGRRGLRHRLPRADGPRPSRRRWIRARLRRPPSLEPPTVRDGMRGASIGSGNFGAGRRGGLDILRPLRGRPSLSFVRRRSNANRRRGAREPGLAAARSRIVESGANNRQHCAGRGRGGPRQGGEDEALPQAPACRMVEERRDFLLYAGEEPQPACRVARQGAPCRAPAWRNPAQRRRDAAQRRLALRNLLDAWRVRARS